MLTFLMKRKEVIFLIAALLTIFTVILFTILPKIIKWVDKKLFFSNRIYLTLSDSDKDIKLINEGKPIIFPRKIKKNESIKFCFSLVQKNNPAPEISTIFVIFPDSTKIKTHPYGGLAWQKSNSPRNEYFLDCPSNMPFTKGAMWNLPILEVILENPAKINLEYAIIGNAMEDIRRNVLIYGDTNFVYTKEYKNHLRKRNELAQAERLPDSVGFEFFPRPKNGDIIAIDHQEGKIIHAEDIKKLMVKEKNAPVDSLECERRVKEISDEVVKDAKTFEEKALALRRYVHKTINKAPYIGAIGADGEPMIQEEYYNFRDKKRFQMNTIDKLNLGYEWCDGTASVFMHLAEKQNIKTRMVYLRVIENEELKSPHTIAEALSPDNNKWVIIDTDPSYDLELDKDGKMVSREDIKEDKGILEDNPILKENPALWGSKDYLSMFHNNLAQELDYEQASMIYKNLENSAKAQKSKRSNDI